MITFFVSVLFRTPNREIGRGTEFRKNRSRFLPWLRWYHSINIEKWARKLLEKKWATQFCLRAKSPWSPNYGQDSFNHCFFHPRISDANFKTVVLDWRIRHTKSGKRALATFRKECDGMRSTTANRYSSKIFRDFSRDIRKTWTWRWHVDLAFDIQYRPFHLEVYVAHPSVKKYIEPTRSCILIRLNALSSRRKFFPCWQKCHISPCFNR